MGCLVFSSFFIILLFYSSPFIDAGNVKAELRTKQLLTNIRTHLARQVQEVVEQKECESGLVLCEPAKIEDEESAEMENDDDDAPRIRGPHKPLIKVNPKQIIQGMIHKVHIHAKPTHELHKVKPPKLVATHQSQHDNGNDGDERERIKDEVSRSHERDDGETKNTDDDDEEQQQVGFPKEIAVFSATSSGVKGPICRKHSRLFLRQLQRYKMWALMMFDASAKLPSGILQGNTNQFGDFDECLSVNAVVKNKKPGVSEAGIQGRYCLAAVDIHATCDEGALRQAVHRAEAYGFIRSNAHDPGYFIPRFTTINWGVCVPSSCSARDVENALKDQLAPFNEASGISFDVVVQDEACVDREDLQANLSFGTIVTFIFYLTVVSAAGYGMYRDIRTSAQDDAEEAEEHSKQGNGRRLVMAFSLKKTSRELVSEADADEISCLHGIKAILTAMLYLAHKVVPIALTPYHNRVSFTKITNEAGSTVLRTSMIYTDSFLLVSGLLTSYNLTRELMQSGKMTWFHRLLTRYLRLTFPLLAVILFYGYISPLLGTGPMWRTIVGKNAQLCRQNGWLNLFYIQTFFPFEEMCAPQTHQLALDMQLSVLAPLIVSLLYQYNVVGALMLNILLLISATLRYITTSNNQLTLVFYHGVTVDTLNDAANLLYTRALYRATPYVLGVIIGYYLQTREALLRTKLQLKAVATVGWAVALCLALLSMLIPSHLASKDYRYDAEEAAQYAALSPISWSLALAWLISACHLGYGGKLNQMLSSWPLLLLSRISYAVYLIQFLVFNHNVGTIRAPRTFSLYQALDLSEVTITLVLSVMVTLLFDLPMRRVKQILVETMTKQDRDDGQGRENEEPEEPIEEEEEEEEEETANNGLQTSSLEELEERLDDEEKGDVNVRYPPDYELEESNEDEDEDGGEAPHLKVKSTPIEDDDEEGQECNFWSNQEEH